MMMKDDVSGLAAAKMKTGTAAIHGEGLDDNIVLVPVSVGVVVRGKGDYSELELLRGIEEDGKHDERSNKSKSEAAASLFPSLFGLNNNTITSHTSAPPLRSQGLPCSGAPLAER